MLDSINRNITTNCVHAIFAHIVKEAHHAVSISRECRVSPYEVLSVYVTRAMVGPRFTGYNKRERTPKTEKLYPKAVWKKL